MLKSVSGPSIKKKRTHYNNNTINPIKRLLITFVWSAAIRGRSLVYSYQVLMHNLQQFNNKSDFVVTAVTHYSELFTRDSAIKCTFTIGLGTDNHKYRILKTMSTIKSCRFSLSCTLILFYFHFCVRFKYIVKIIIIYTRDRYKLPLTNPKKKLFVYETRHPVKCAKNLILMEQFRKAEYHAENRNI